MQTRICHECGQAMARDTRPLELRYREQAMQVEMPGWYCVCGESIHEGKDLAVSDRALNRLKARAEGLLEPEEIARIRQHLKLSQRKAGELLGGGPNAFHKYEKGEVLVSKAVANLLKVLDHEPAALAVLMH